MEPFCRIFLPENKFIDLNFRDRTTDQKKVVEFFKTWPTKELAFVWYGFLK